MQQFIIISKNQEMGPFTLKQLQVMLQEDAISWYDFIVDIDDGTWTMLLQYEPLTTYFNASFNKPMIALSDAKAEWYFLKSNQNHGPFTTEDMLKMIEAQNILEHDFVWKKEFSAWKKISEISEFKDSNFSPNVNVVPPLRRKFFRQKSNINAFVKNGSQVYKSIGVDISEGGACLYIPDSRLIKVGDMITLHFQPSEFVPKFSAEGKVVTCKDSYYGIQFKKIHLPSMAKHSQNQKLAKKKSA